MSGTTQLALTNVMDKWREYEETRDKLLCDSGWQFGAVEGTMTKTIVLKDEDALQYEQWRKQCAVLEL